MRVTPQHRTSVPPAAWERHRLTPLTASAGRIPDHVRRGDTVRVAGKSAVFVGGAPDGTLLTLTPPVPRADVERKIRELDVVWRAWWATYGPWRDGRPETLAGWGEVHVVGPCRPLRVGMVYARGGEAPGVDTFVGCAPDLTPVWSRGRSYTAARLAVEAAWEEAWRFAPPNTPRPWPEPAPTPAPLRAGLGRFRFPDGRRS